MNVTVIPAIHYAGTGTQTQFTIPFDYLRKAFVKVNVDDAPVTNFTILGSELEFEEAPAVGADIYIYRDTNTTRLVSWRDASVLHAKDMTIQQVQELHILEEEDYSFSLIREDAETARDAAIEAKEKAETANTNAQYAANIAIESAETAADRVKQQVFDYVDAALADSGDGVFQYDHNMNIMPVLQPIGNDKWDIDENGNIMPKEEVVL